jgi:hypothetical protein
MTDDATEIGPRGEAAPLSPKRARIASFAYRLACRRAHDQAESQLVIATGDPLQAHVVVDAAEVMPGGRFAEARISAVVCVARERRAPG